MAAVKAVRIAAFLLVIATVANAAEGFGSFRNVVAMERLSPPQRVLPVKHIAIIFDDGTQRAAPLRQRIEALIHESHTLMRIGADAPYTITIHVREFLASNTRSIAGSFTVSDRAGRELYDSEFSASNAGALVNTPDDRLIDDAARDVARIIVPTDHHTAVLIPKGRLDVLAPIAERGEWSTYLTGVEQVPEVAGDSESYRQYALAVGHEALAYAMNDPAARVQHLQEAVRRNLAASHLKPSEKLFAEMYSPMSRMFASPGLPPRVWVDPHAMELWESVALIDSWMKATQAPSGTLDNRGVLELAVAGRTDESIVAAITATKQVNFTLGQAEMTALSKAGVQWAVIDAMRKKAGLPRREFRITPDSW
jgi:hypothetical protein